MSKFDLDEMNNCYLDVLREIGNIGAGNATTALAQLLQRKVDMTVPQAELLEFKEVGKVIGGEESIMAGVYMVVEGDISGSMMFLLEKESARHLVNQMLCKPDDEGASSDVFDEMEISVMKEIGNIITGAYLNALSSLTNMKIYPSTPQLSIDMAGALLSVPAVEFGLYADKILLVQTKFSDDVELDGYFILIPDMESYEKILKTLGVM